MTRADRVLSTPRKTAPKIRTQKNNVFDIPPTSPLVVLNDDKPSASVARAEQIVYRLTVCYVRKVSRRRARRRHQLFLQPWPIADWVLAGDIRGMICGLAKYSERAAEVAGPIEAPAGKAVRS